MTSRTAITWLILAAIFASCAFIVNQLGSSTLPTSSASVRLLETDLNHISSLVFTTPGEPAITFTASPGTSTWLAHRAGGVAWPVESGRISALLRVLAGTVGLPVTDQSVSDAATSIALSGPDGSPGPVIRVDTQSLAGRTLVEVAESGSLRTLLIDDALRRALSGAGPMSWRDRRAFPGLPSDPSRIVIRMPAHTIELARIGTRWGLRSPFVARADPDAVSSVIRALQAMECTRFIDALPADTPTFPEQSQVALIIESAFVDPATSERLVDRWTLDLGGAAPQGSAFIARVARSPAEPSSTARLAHGPAIIELGSDRLATVPAAVEAYFARTVLDVPASDVGAISLATPDASATPYQRTPAGWAQADPSATTPTPVPDADRRALDSLVALLAESRPDRTTVLISEDALPGGMTLTIAGLSGQPLESCSLFLDETGERPQIVVRVGRVVRTYLTTPELASWINARGQATS